MVDLGAGATTQIIDDSTLWTVVALAVAIAGIVVQLRDADRRRTGLRSAWVDDGGRSLTAR